MSKPVPTLTVRAPKPRNPFARQAAARHAGAHGPSRSAQRQADRRALQREITRLHSPPAT